MSFTEESIREQFKNCNKVDCFRYDELEWFVDLYNKCVSAVVPIKAKSFKDFGICFWNPSLKDGYSNDTNGVIQYCWKIFYYEKETDSVWVMRIPDTKLWSTIDMVFGPPNHFIEGFRSLMDEGIHPETAWEMLVL